VDLMTCKQARGRECNDDNNKNNNTLNENNKIGSSHKPNTSTTNFKTQKIATITFSHLKKSLNFLA